MVVVRLARGGAKKRPFYHIVVSDSRKSRDSGYLEKLGYFNPSAVKEEPPVFLNRDRFDYWISKGAKSSPRVSAIISKLDKGKFKEKAKAETKKTEASPKEATAEDTATTETNNATAEPTTTKADDTIPSAEQRQKSKVVSPQTELDLENRPEEAQAVLSAEQSTSELSESDKTKTSVESPKTPEADKKTDDR